MPEGELQRRAAAHGVAHDGRRAGPHVIEHRRAVVGEVLVAERLVTVRRAAMALQVDAYGGVTARDRGQQT